MVEIKQEISENRKIKKNNDQYMTFQLQQYRL